MDKKFGPPLGNNNAGKNKIWSLAIQKALKRRSKSDQLEELGLIADALLNKCIEGDMVAIKELGDRLEGKANQSISGPGEGAIAIIAVTRPQLSREEWLASHALGTTARPTE